MMKMILLQTEHLDCCRQAFIQPQLNFIRSGGKPSITVIFIETKKFWDMLWIQSMPRIPYGYMQIPIGWKGMGMPTNVCVHIPIGRVYLNARGVKKNSVPDMIKVKLTYVPVKGGIVYSDINRFFWFQAIGICI